MRSGRWISAVLAVSLGAWHSSASAQIAAPLASPSDDRATFVPGNVTTCAGAGIVVPGFDVIQVGAHGSTAANDPNVSGTVSPRPGGGEQLNVTITGANVVIDAVVVKGGDGFNLYTNPAVLPPTLPAPQNYISPMVGAGNIPQISHWFICYHETVPLATGTLEVTKTVILPSGIPVTPLPTSFTALVNCNDGNPAHQNVVISFGNGGGRSSTPDLVGIPAGTVCTVVEQTGNAPTVTYTPAGADSAGVTIPADEGVVVNITNDFSSVPVQRATLQFVKQVVIPPGVDPPASFTVFIACDDGTSASVTLPGAGGPGTPDVSVRTVSMCAFIEAPATLPGGWTVSYQVDGGTPSSTPPLIPVIDATTITITVINDATAVEPPTTTSTTTTTIAPTTTTTSPIDPSTTTTAAPAPPAPTTTIGGASGGLPATGQTNGSLVLVAALLVAVGATLVLSRRHRAD